MPKDPDTRTVAEVEHAQDKRAVFGWCCERFAENSGCNCLADAHAREFQVKSRGWRTPSQGDITAGQSGQLRNDGPYPQVHPRHYSVAKAEGEFLTWVMGWRDRHGLTLSEALSIVGRELTRSLEQCVASERKSGVT